MQYYILYTLYKVYVYSVDHLIYSANLKRFPQNL